MKNFIIQFLFLIYLGLQLFYCAEKINRFTYEQFSFYFPEKEKNKNNDPQNYFKLTSSNLNNISLIPTSLIEYNENFTIKYEFTSFYDNTEIKKLIENDTRLFTVDFATVPESPLSITVKFFVDNSTFPLNKDSEFLNVYEGSTIFSFVILRQSGSVGNSYLINLELKGSTPMKIINNTFCDFGSGYVDLTKKIMLDNDQAKDAKITFENGKIQIFIEETSSITTYSLGLKSKWVSNGTKLIEYIWVGIICLIFLLFFGIVLFKIVSLIKSFLQKKGLLDIKNINKKLLDENNLSKIQ